MRKNLLSEIKKLKDISNVIILTHNIDFVFIQSLLLRAFRNAGAPRVTIFADAGCASESYLHQAKYLVSLGRRYRVVPVPSNPGFRFHPKALFLSGKKAAHLYVGSGNLSFGGWKENAEVWTHFDVHDGVVPFMSFKDYLYGISKRLELKETVTQEIAEAFDPRKHEWIPEELADPDTTSPLIGRLGSGLPLIDSILGVLGNEAYDSLTICSPYYDPQGDAYQDLASKINADKIQVLVSAKGNNLTPFAYSKIKSDAVLRPVMGIASTGEAKKNLVHAKFYAARRGDSVKILIGSANCSRAALLCEGNSGNTELMAYREISRQVFEDEFISEVHSDEAELEVSEESTEQTEQNREKTPFILAARKDFNRLLLAYSPVDCEIIGVQFEHGLQSAEVERPGICAVDAPAQISNVQLKVRYNGEEVFTPPHWIDHEQDLATTSFRRTLEEKLRGNISSSNWTTDVLADAVKLIVDDLNDTPARKVEQETTRKSSSKDKLSYHQSELYSSRVSSVFARRSTHQSAFHNISVPELILHYLGYYDIDAHSDSSVKRDEDSGIGLHPDVDSEEDVDQPEDVTSAKPTARVTIETEADKKKYRKKFSGFVKKMAATFESEEYRKYRHPLDVARDVKLVALVLRQLKKKRWVEDEDFFGATQRILASLFLGEDNELPAAIWEVHSNGSSSPVIHPEVAGALFAWTLLVHNNPESKLEAQCLLSLSVAVSKWPQIWKVEDANALVGAVDKILAATEEHIDYSGVAARWESLAKLSATLQHWDEIFRTMKPDELRKLNTSNRIEKGELLFQVPWGFAVCDNEKHVLLSSTRPVKVLLLTKGVEQAKKIQAKSLNPVHGLLTNKTVWDRLESKGGNPNELLELCRIVEIAGQVKKSDILERAGIAK